MALKGFERRLERMVEGTFSRLFRSTIRPVELGRRLVREMDDNRSVDVRGRTLVPNAYAVELSETDYEQFSEVADGLERELAEARRLQPEHFAAPMVVSADEFRAMVDAEARTLSPEQISDLKLVALETVDLPSLRDLTLEEPALSPTILGLFRGLPLGEEPSEPRTIVLYRKNLLRAVRSREELQREIRTTLLHELGHLRGADDDDLRERGLE